VLLHGKSRFTDLITGGEMSSPLQLLSPISMSRAWNPEPLILLDSKLGLAACGLPGAKVGEALTLAIDWHCCGDLSNLLSAATILVSTSYAWLQVQRETGSSSSIAAIKELQLLMALSISACVMECAQVPPRRKRSLVSIFSTVRSSLRGVLGQPRRCASHGTRFNISFDGEPVMRKMRASWSELKFLCVTWEHWHLHSDFPRKGGTPITISSNTQPTDHSSILCE
jgi:hypothetical protein